MRSLRLGTRGSRLARWQAEWVRGRLAAQGASSDIVIVETRGDAEVDRPLQQLEGKGFFTKEIEEALRPLEHAPSAQAVAAERAMLAALGGGCQAAVAAYTGNRETGNGKRLFGRVLAVDGAVQLTASVDVDPARPAAAGEELARLLEAHGALELLAR